MKPNLFIVGTPKAGTTSLYKYLEAHPDVFMSPVKETNFFTCTEIQSQSLYYNAEWIDTPEKYHRLFNAVSGQKIVGEASVSYLFYPDTAQKLYAYNPAARIIIILRDPVERAFSHYLMDKRLGFVKYDLEDIVNAGKRGYNNGLHYQQFIELGLYHDQVARYLEVFPREQVRIFFHEDITRNTTQWLAEIGEFLGLDSMTLSDTTQHNSFTEPKGNALKSIYRNRVLRKMLKAIIPASLKYRIQNGLFDKQKPLLDPAVRSRLREFYASDVEKLELLLGRELKHWYKE